MIFEDFLFFKHIGKLKSGRPVELILSNFDSKTTWQQ